MKVSSKTGSVIAAAALALAFGGVAMAQSASSDFSTAGQETKSAGTSAGHAVVNAAKGTATATEDSTLTGKVKWNLHEDKVTKDQDIHVKTIAGVVHLYGSVNTEEAAREATRVAERTSGVKGVHNNLHVTSARAE
ncbi:MAG TPA: BON domain-containing protein [Candidatus Binataceae bacterium]|jgi:osmotically-inducible protein OsmY|nr:BON domain-containing protein [Candidatus Binataceae bacterium]